MSTRSGSCCIPCSPGISRISCPAARLTKLRARSATFEPEPPNLAIRRVESADLDHILLKALRKEPARRYVSVDQFSEDIRRHLEGLPVIAREDTLSYRCAKFVRRHRVGVIAAAFAAVALVAGVAAIAREAHIARVARAKAEERYNDVRQLAGSLVFEVHDAIRDLPGATPARELVLKRGVQFLDNIAREAASDLSLQRELADAYRKVGDVQGQAGASNLGLTAAALDSYQKALGLRQRVAGAAPPSFEDRRQLASAYANVAYVMGNMGNANEAEANHQRALQIREALAASRPGNMDARSDLATSYFQIGLHHSQTGDLSGALENYLKSLPLYQQVADARPSSANDQRNLSLAHKRAGAILIVRNQLPEAREHYQTAMAIDEARCAANPADSTARLDLTFTYSDLALILWRSGELSSALKNYRKVLPIREALAAADPKNVRAQSSLADTYTRVGAILNDLGDAEGAIVPLRRALAIRQALLSTRPSPETRFSLANIYFDLAQAYGIRAKNHKGPVGERLERWREVRDWYRQCVPIFLEMKTAGKLYDADSRDLDIAVRSLQYANAEVAKLSSSP